MIHFCTEQQLKTLQAWEQNWLNSSWSHFLHEIRMWWTDDTAAKWINISWSSFVL